MSLKNLESFLDYSDPLELISRALTKLYSLWVSKTFPFASTGARLSIHPSVDLKRAMARGIQLGNNIVIAKDAWLNVPDPLRGETAPAIIIDDNCAIGRRSQISAKNRVHLERDVILSPSTLVMDHNHAFENVTLPPRSQGITDGGTIRIEEGCWIGLGAAIVCGKGELVIGKHSVVGANSVVTRSVPPYSVVAGNPAKTIKQFNPVKKVWVKGSSRSAESPSDREEPEGISLAKE